MDQNSTESRLDKLLTVPDVDMEWEEMEKVWHLQKDSFITQVKAGMEGLNIGFENGLTSANKYLHGTHRGRYYLVGADSGVGKTTFSDFAYIFSLWLSCRKRNVKLKVFYFSLEISRNQKIARWVCQWVKRMYNLDFSVDYVLGYIEGKPMTSDHYKMVMRGYGLVEEMLVDIELIDYSLSPTAMLNVVLEYYEKNGIINRDAPKEGQKRGAIKSYVANDPSVVVEVITDHIALIPPEFGATSTKEIMDRWSMYGVQLRNIFNTLIINIQQFSTSLQHAGREKKTPVQLTPQRLDFGDSTYTFRDADIVFGLVKPVQANLESFFGYDLRQLKVYLLALYLLKNRYGAADRMIPLFTNPVAGTFLDMPLPNTEACLPFVEEVKRLDNLI